MIYIFLGEIFRTTLGSANVLVFGVLVCLIIMFLPNGIVGESRPYQADLYAEERKPVGVCRVIFLK